MKIKSLKSKVLLVIAFVVLLCVVLFDVERIQYEENTAKSLACKLVEASRLNAYQSSNNLLIATVVDAGWIADFISAVEFESDSAAKVAEVKIPPDYDLAFIGATTQQLHLVAGEYLRSSSGALLGDVRLTKESAEEIKRMIQGVLSEKQP